jgi:hypothetical protein
LIYEFVHPIFISTSRSAAVPELWTLGSIEHHTTNNTYEKTNSWFITGIHAHARIHWLCDGLGT